MVASGTESPSRSARSVVSERSMSCRQTRSASSAMTIVRPQRLNRPALPLSSRGMGPMMRETTERSRVSAIGSSMSMPARMFGPMLPMPSRTTFRPPASIASPTRSASSSDGLSTNMLRRQVSSVVTREVDL